MHEAVETKQLSSILHLEPSEVLHPEPSKFLRGDGKTKVRVPPDAFAAPPAFTARGDHPPGICQSADGVP